MGEDERVEWEARGGERETEAIKLGSLIGFLIFPFIGLLPLMYPNGPG